MNGHNNYTLAQALEALLTRGGQDPLPIYVLYLSGMSFGMENPEMCKIIQGIVADEMPGAHMSPVAGKYDLLRALRIVQEHGGYTQEVENILEDIYMELTDADPDEVSKFIDKLNLGGGDG